MSDLAPTLCGLQIHGFPVTYEYPGYVEIMIDRDIVFHATPGNDPQRPLYVAVDLDIAGVCGPAGEFTMAAATPAEWMRGVAPIIAAHVGTDGLPL